MWIPAYIRIIRGLLARSLAPRGKQETARFRKEEKARERESKREREREREREKRRNKGFPSPT